VSLEMCPGTVLVGNCGLNVGDRLEISRLRSAGGETRGNVISFGNNRHRALLPVQKVRSRVCQSFGESVHTLVVRKFLC
jgi:hypothetical protein